MTLGTCVFWSETCSEKWKMQRTNILGKENGNATQRKMGENNWERQGAGP